MLRVKSKPGYRVALLIGLIIVGILIVYYTKSGKDTLPSVSDWPEYNGGSDRNHYSSLSQITAANVSTLEKVWEYSSGGADTAKNQTQIQCNPIIIDGVLYGVSAGSQAFAVDASNGNQLWKTNFDDDTYSMTCPRLRLRLITCSANICLILQKC